MEFASGMAEAFRRILLSARSWRCEDGMSDEAGGFTGCSLLAARSSVPTNMKAFAILETLPDGRQFLRSVRNPAHGWLVVAHETMPDGRQLFRSVARGYEFIVEERIIDGVQQRAVFKQRILIVDDEPMTILEILLERAGFECVKVLGGGDALALLDAGEKFDLITTDIVNYPMDGFTFRDKLRRQYPGIPVLVITSAPDIGYPHYLSKGRLDAETLPAAVRRILGVT